MPLRHLFKRRLKRAALLLLIYLSLPTLCAGCATSSGTIGRVIDPPPEDLAHPCRRPQLAEELETVTVGEAFGLYRQTLADYLACALRHDALVKAWPR